MREYRVYLVDPNELEVSYTELTDDEFMEEAERLGTIFTLEGFQDEFEAGGIDSESFAMRIIEVETISIDIETMGLDGKPQIHIDPDNEPVPMKEIYRIMHKRMKEAKTEEMSNEIFDILQEIKFPEEYK